MGQCLSDQELAALLAGSGTAQERTAWRRHLRVCDPCATRLARLRVEFGQAPGQGSESGPEQQTGSGPGLATALEPNVQIGDFRIERRLGSGGMGVVYQAMQVSLNRRVALKVLPSSLAMDASALERFHREARAAAGLDHPHIVAVHTEGQEGGVCYYAMELIEGRDLDQILKDLRTSSLRRSKDAEACETLDGGDLKAHPANDWPQMYHERSGRDYFQTVAGLAADVADALDYAHQRGVIHRDVKPPNLILAEDGRLVLTDFGIARVCHDQAMTLSGSFLGTPFYMSPEQIRGDPNRIDLRTDVYSLGVTLYELLTLQPVFGGDSRDQIMIQIVNQEPRRPRQIDRRIPVDLDTICCKAIEKDPARRYQTTAQLAEDLRRYVGGQVIKARRAGPLERSVKVIRRYPLSAALIGVIVVGALVAAGIGWYDLRVTWAQEQAIPQIVRWIEQDQFLPAFFLARRAQRVVPSDPVLEGLWPRLSTPCTITSEPPGAEVWISAYEARESPWFHLGRTPLEQVRVPFGTHRWRAERTGYDGQVCVRSIEVPARPQEPTGPIYFNLKAGGPAGMAWIPPSDLDQKNLFHGTGKIPSAPGFWIDRCEVTHRQYQEFADAGAYRDPNAWQGPFIKDGQALTWDQAVTFFRDSTGVPGPASWSHGTYPPGQGDYPVGGISWYEAVAYARFRGNDLPTLFHWNKAARANDVSSRITNLSNFGDGPAPVGSHKGMGHFGLYDVAGNVREWCVNSLQGAEDLRCILGGSWGENPYTFITGAARSAWDRDFGNGLRCALYPGGRDNVQAEAFAPLENKARDFSRFQPVSDEVFQSYLTDLYRYDPTPLNATVEAVDEDLGICHRERITLDAAYPRERVIAYLHLPKGVAPPYQTVVWFPGGDVRYQDWDGRHPYSHEFMCVLESGRAVILPIYKGTYQRRLAERLPPEGIQSRNLYVQISQDLRRCADYLETRQDLDLSRLAYVGLSWGGLSGPIMIATEPRFKTGILLLGGICACTRHPSADPAEFAPHVKIPILMLNGRYDSYFPYETAQRPLFNLLGTPESDKRHVVFPGEHGIPWEYRRPYHQQILDWLDRYLGPVNRSAASSIPGPGSPSLP